MPEEKRMLMVSTVPSMIGQFNLENIKLLIQMGYTVDVAADFKDLSVWPKERIEQFINDMSKLGVECIQIDFTRNPLKIFRHVRSYREALELIKSRHYSFIHTHTPIASAIVRMASHKTKTKLIYTAHGFHFYYGAPLKNWVIYYPVEKFLSRYTDVLITINREDYTRASKKFHVKKVVYMPGVGVDTKKFSNVSVDKKAKRAELGIKDDDFMLLSVGELSDRKNQKVIIDALGQMKKEGKLGNTKYFAVGKGDKQSEFEHRIHELQLDSNVFLLGFRSDIIELCAVADCFVHPSVREGLGIAPLEAMAAGLPLISANINGIKDYTENGVTGCCIEPTNVNEMVSAIIKMKNDKTFRDRCGKNNREIVKKFDKSNIEQIMKEVYENSIYMFLH